MIKNEEEIKKEIRDYIERNGSVYSQWYVGISEDARSRLFIDHHVDEKNDFWIIREATSSAAARRIEKYFVEVVGTDGGTGGGDEEADKVYAYQKNLHTSP